VDAAVLWRSRGGSGALREGFISAARLAHLSLGETLEPSCGWMRSRVGLIGVDGRYQLEGARVTGPPSPGGGNVLKMVLGLWAFAC
jgi:hypothetical protein